MASKISKEIDLAVKISNMTDIHKVNTELERVERRLKEIAELSKTATGTTKRAYDAETQALRRQMSDLQAQQANILQYTKAINSNAAAVKKQVDEVERLKAQRAEYNKQVKEGARIERQYAEWRNRFYAKRDWATLYSKRGAGVRGMMSARGEKWGDIMHLSREDRGAYYQGLISESVDAESVKAQNKEQMRRRIEQSPLKITDLARSVFDTKRQQAYSAYDTDVQRIAANKKEIETLRLSGRAEDNAKADLLEKQNARLSEDAAKQQAAAQAATKAMATISGILSFVKLIARTARSTNALVKETTGISLSVKDMFADVRKNVSSMLDLYKGAGTYDASSLITNASARNLRLRYGLSASQAYAFDKTTSIMGLQNGDLNENLAYMTADQRQLFADLTSKYETWYTKLDSSGVFRNIQEMRLDFAMFKEEMSVEIMQFVADNKETILGALKAALQIAELITKITAWLGTFGHMFGANTSAVSDNYNNNYNTSKTLHMSVSNYINGAGDNGDLAARISDAISQDYGNTMVALGG